MAAKRGQLEKNLERMFKDIEKWAEELAKKAKRWY